MTYMLYRCPRIQRGCAPDHEAEVLIGRFPTFDAAADAANTLRRSDTRHSYTVGMA